MPHLLSKVLKYDNRNYTNIFILFPVNLWFEFNSGNKNLSILLIFQDYSTHITKFMNS